MYGPKGSTTSATLGCGVHSIVPSCTSSNSAWRGTQPPPLPPRPNPRRMRPMAGARPSERVTCVHPAVRACSSSSACSRGTRGGHHEPQSHRVASPCRHHRGRRFPEPWPPTTRVPSSRKPWPEARFSLTLLPADPTRRPAPHPSSHLGGSQMPPQSSHECASQQVHAVLKFHTGRSCGSVQQRLCVGSAPQKLFFVMPLEI